MKTIRPFSPQKLGQPFSISKKGQGRPFATSCASVLIWWKIKKHKKFNARLLNG